MRVRKLPSRAAIDPGGHDVHRSLLGKPEQCEGKASRHCFSQKVRSAVGQIFLQTMTGLHVSKEIGLQGKIRIPTGFALTFINGQWARPAPPLSWSPPFATKPVNFVGGPC
jgi:hypothetical protein